MNQWFLSFLSDNYGPDFRQMKQYGFVVLDVPMLFNDTEYSQTIIGPKDYDLVVSVSLKLLHPFPQNILCQNKRLEISLVHFLPEKLATFRLLVNFAAWKNW